MSGDIINISNIKDSISSHKAGIIGQETEYRRYGVVIPLADIDGELCVLFEVRAMTLRSQPGEISFPGGKIEPDEDSLKAAIRETCEEIGVCEDDIEVLGETDILITPHNRIIYPYAVKIKDANKINPSKDEVDHVFYVPVKFFIGKAPLVKHVNIVSEPEDDFFPYSDMKKVKMSHYKWDVGKNRIYFYRYDNYIIWGITAKILFNFIDIIKRKKIDE